MDEEFKALKKVIKDWGVFELVFVVIFFPFSLLYLLLRIIQEMDSD